MSEIDRLVESLAEEATPVTPVPSPFLLTLKWIAGAGAYLVVALLIAGPRPDLMDQFHQPWFGVELLSLLLIFLSTVFSAALLAFPDLHQKRRAAYAPAVAFALFVAVLFFSWRHHLPPPPLPVHSYQCTLSITLCSVLPAGWLFYLMRGYASTHPRLAGVNVLLAAFSVAALWLRLHEVNNSITHVVIWHYLPMLAVGALGVWLGRRVLSW